MTIFWIIILLVVVWAVLVYNSFIRRINQTNEAWSDIDVQLKRRHDLIPNLVETVKGYATHESLVFENVTKARAKALSAGTVAEKGAAENQLSAAMKSIFAVAEAYPQLRAVESFTKLQDELSDTENKVQASRRFYNGNVRDLNISLDSFPGNFLAKMFSFAKREFFQADEGDKEPVQVKF
ncbi:MAG: LemA family protein [Patescibacteria group bacterium]